MSEYLQIRPFSDIDLRDSFFDGLKNGYAEFSEWYQRKARQGATAYVLHCDGKLTGFMYLKIEDGEVEDTTPKLPPARRIKIGTLKVDAHGTRLGERFLKKAIDFALAEQAEELYLTVFPKHDALIDLIIQLGFADVGEKVSPNGAERVHLKRLAHAEGGTLRENYPFLDVSRSHKYLLAIHPQWHTQLFPDSILENESYDVLEDVSHTNSIRKTYVCSMRGVAELRTGDLVVIYRTKDNKGPAHYRSVATSVCTVEQMRAGNSFANLEEYIKFTQGYSVFNRRQLESWWQQWKALFVIKMLYSASFSKRLIRKALIEDIGLSDSVYWGFMGLTDEQFLKIIEAGGVDERLVVDKA